MSVNVSTAYSDKLVTISDTAISFSNYYFPIGGRKVVRFGEIEGIRVEKPTMWTGKWRLQGTGDFRTWFPMDGKRPERDRIFIVSLKDRWSRIGFTAENGARVEELLRSKGFIGRA